MTDANVVLGYMPAGTVADGQISISAELAEQAVRRVAEPLGLTLLEAASGIHRIANARMTRALRAVSSEKGRDPRDFALIAYGGAGPIHAAGLAEDLGMRTVLVPAVAGLFSAVGLLFARPEFHEVRTCHLDVDAVDPAVVAALFAEMEAKLAHALDGRSEVEWARTADLRYGGQSWEVEVGFPGRHDRRGVLARCGRASRTSTSGSTASRTRRARRSRSARCASRRSARRRRRAPSSSTARTRRGRLEPADPLAGDGVDAPVRTRSSVGETPEPGPLLVDEYDTTVVVPPGWSARRDAATGTLVLERDAMATKHARRPGHAPDRRQRARVDGGRDGDDDLPHRALDRRPRRDGLLGRRLRREGTGRSRRRSACRSTSARSPPRWRRSSSTTRTGSGRATSS